MRISDWSSDVCSSDLPAAASAIEHALSWHYVFLALLPFVVLAGAITIPVLSRTAPEGAQAAADAGARRRHSVLLTAAVAALLAAIPAPAVPVAVVRGAGGVPVPGVAFLRWVPHGP